MASDKAFRAAANQHFRQWGDDMLLEMGIAYARQLTPPPGLDDAIARNRRRQNTRPPLHSRPPLTPITPITPAWWEMAWDYDRPAGGSVS